MDHSRGPHAEARKPHLGWSRPLARPVKVHRGSTLVTLADVRTFLFKRLDANRQVFSIWRRVTALLLAAARSAEVDAADLTIALEMAANLGEGPRQSEPE